MAKRSKEPTECRMIPAKLELRAGDANGPLEISGYAAKFDTLSDDLGGFREEIAPGAFDPLDQDVRATWNHEPQFVLGRQSNGTLQLATDDTGLRFTVTPPDTSWARDLVASMKRGDVREGSFMFRVRPNGEEWRDDEGVAIRRLTAVRLRDVAVVAYPAYPDTAVAARSLEAYRAGETDSAGGTPPAPAPDHGNELLNAGLRDRNERAEQWTGPDGWNDDK